MMILSFLILLLTFISTSGENIKNIERSDVPSDVALLLENRVVDGDVHANEDLGIDNLRRRLFRSRYEKTSGVHYNIGNKRSHVCWYRTQWQMERACDRLSSCLGYGIYQNGGRNFPLCLIFDLHYSERVGVRSINFYKKPRRSCRDTNNGRVDRYGDGCEIYGITAYCGRFDSATFKSLDMCCGCGGGRD